MVLAALKKAWKNGFIGFHVLTDTQEVIYALNGGLDWSINSIILDIKFLASLFLSVYFEFIPRAPNKQAHKLVKFCFSSRHDVDWNWASGILLTRG